MRYLALVALLAFLAVPVLSGCGDTGKTTPKPDTTKKAPEKAGEKAPEAPPAPPATPPATPPAAPATK